MTTGVGFCLLADDLAQAAAIMRQKDCGIVPVLDAARRVVGVVTDRDICLAAEARRLSLNEIKIAEMSLTAPSVCAPEDDVKDVLRRMRKRRVKRLPVVNDQKELLGIVSLSDILLKAGDKKSVKKLILSILKTTAKPAPIVLREQTDPPENKSATAV
jgi:CBS domain-containing protein